MKILLSPYSKSLRNGGRNPKNYPYWEELAFELINEGYDLYQFSVHGEVLIHEDVDVLYEMKLKDIPNILKDYDTFVSVDNFFPHLAAYYDFPGFVIWGKSNPEIYGHGVHTNLLKDKKYLRPDQFRIWEQTEYNADAFMSPLEIFEKIKKFKKD